jgi:phosphocarrier protein FPr
VPLDQVPDPVFAQRLAGDGISVDPLSQQLLAPCDGEVVQVHRAAHALTLSAAEVEVMMHIGLDTVNLKGQGFTAHVKAGDRVRTGDLLISFDADYVATHARSLLTQVLVTALEGQQLSLRPRVGHVTAGRDVLLEVLVGGAARAAAEGPTGDAVTSNEIVIASETGLHARPAALVAAAARQFISDLRLVKEGREANARSVVSIMALEVAGGDSVTVVARGEDAAAAVAALTQTLTSDLGHPQTTVVSGRTVALESPDVARPALTEDGSLRGVPASPGVAIGAVFQLRHVEAVPEERAADPNHERRALDAAIASAHLQLEALQARLAAEADTDKAAIFAAHQELLEDPEVLDAAAAHIRAGASAAHAWRQAYSAQATRLLGLKNQLLAGRAADLRDVGRRVLHLLVGSDEAPTQAVPVDSIVVAEDLTPSDAASLDRTRVRGFCTTMGSATSHVAILARGLGIPAVAGIDPRVLDLTSGTRVVLDGDAGTLKAEPSKAEEKEIARRQEETERRRAAQFAEASAPAVTRDGHRVEVVANIGDEGEAQRVVELGGEGVGLLRTEFLFMDRKTEPDETEQARVYEAIARTLGPDRILVIRTLDVGGDKPLPYLAVGTEANPFLGERGIRLTLNHPDTFRTQVRAILRASRHGKVAIMFPMVATLAEWRAGSELVEHERNSLGVPPIPVGIMVETSAAALLADRFAQEADFFSIGTNDLTQYTLAMDRTNPRLAPQVDALHPSVLRLIEHTVSGAHKHKRWVGICGALAGDPDAVPVLVGLGVDELSVSVPIVPEVKARIRTLTLAECKALAKAALDAGDGNEVRALVGKRFGT